MQLHYLQFERYGQASFLDSRAKKLQIFFEIFTQMYTLCLQQKVITFVSHVSFRASQISAYEKDSLPGSQRHLMSAMDSQKRWKRGLFLLVVQKRSPLLKVLLVE